MCNRYEQNITADELRSIFADIENWAGNLEPGEIFPDRTAPIITAEGGHHVLRSARWGLPSPAQFHTASGIDRGVTNVRNAASPHWRRWLGPEHRCLVPLTRFAEPRVGVGAGNAWFKVSGNTPVFFAGLWVPQWSSIRKLKDGQTTDDLYAFLTTEPNAEVAAIHPKAMPVILTNTREWEDWLSLPWSEARALQRPLDDDALILET